MGLANVAVLQWEYGGNNDDFIEDMGQRLRTYKRVSSARDEETLSSIKLETEDRYGRLPAPVERLFEYASLRRLAEQTGVISIDKTATGIAIKFSEKAGVDPEKLAAFLRNNKRAGFSPTGVLRIDLTEAEHEDVLGAARDVLLQIRVSD